MDDDKYVKSSLSSTIWHFLSPSVRVILTGLLVLIMVFLCISQKAVYQELWYLVLLFCGMYNSEILKGTILRKNYIIINVILCIMLCVVFGLQVHTVNEYGSGDSIPAFYAISCINSGKQNIVYSGHWKGNDSYLADNAVGEKELVKFFSEVEEQELTAEERSYGNSNYRDLYAGEKLVASYMTESRGTYQIVHYYK